MSIGGEGEEFGAALTGARRAAGLTQEELARTAGLGLRTVQELERGRAHPRRETARRLAAALDLPLEPWLPFTRRRRRPDRPTPATNLPFPRTSVVGREAEVADGLERLSSTRVLALVGPGGVGKTRLAVELALRSAAAPVLWVEASAESPPLVRLADLLSVQPGAGVDAADTVARALAGLDALLVLDGCEQAVDECGGVASRLLDGCPTLRVVCTSRIPLRIYGEAVLTVPPLAPPAGDDPASVDRSAAGRLFLDRARLVRPDLDLTPEAARGIAALCARLDGLPLSIELAAAATGTVPLERLVERVVAGEALALEGWRDSPPRHRNLREVLAWSHALLDEHERIVFRRLAAFVGSFAAEAAEGVCAGGGIAAGDVLPILRRLVEHSLVVPLEHRFRLLDTIRDYAGELLRASGEEAAVRQRHLACYAAQSDRAFDLLQGPEQHRWLERLDADLENIWAGVRWSVAEPAAGEPDRWERVVLGQPLLSRIWRYWFLRGSCAEAYRWLRRLLDDMGEPPATPEVLQARAFALGGACVMAWHLGDTEAALVLGDESLLLRRRSGDAVGAGNVTLALGIVRNSRGEHRVARALLEQSLRAAEEQADAQMASFSHLYLGHSLGALGQRAAAERAYAAALDAFERTGDRWGAASALRGWGALRRGRDLAGAAELLERSERLFREQADRGWRAQTLTDLGRVRHLQGRLTAARELLEASEQLADEAGYAVGRAERLRLLALVQWDQGDRELAVDHWRRGVELALADAQPALVADCVATVACWLQREPDVQEVAPQLLELLAAAAHLRARTDGLRAPEERASVRRTLGELKLLLDPLAAASAWQRGRGLDAEKAVRAADELIDRALAR